MIYKKRKLIAAMLFIEYINAYGVSSTVIWDNEDYILELFGNFDNNELRDLAISNEIDGF